MQGMDVDEMDEATHMDASPLAVDSPNIVDANVSNHLVCLCSFFESIQVIESLPGCLN